MYRRDVPDVGGVFEEQRPIDFDMNVRPAVQFVPGLKSVVNLPSNSTWAADGSRIAA